jgi:hypothetical protein
MKKGDNARPTVERASWYLVRRHQLRALGPAGAAWYLNAGPRYNGQSTRVPSVRHAYRPWRISQSYRLSTAHRQPRSRGNLKYGLSWHGRFLKGQPYATIWRAAANTSSTCPGTFTFRHAFTIFPSASIRKVDLSTPIYFLPYMLFSTHTP